MDPGHYFRKKLRGDPVPMEGGRRADYGDHADHLENFLNTPVGEGIVENVLLFTTLSGSWQRTVKTCLPLAGAEGPVAGVQPPAQQETPAGPADHQRRPFLDR